ncbi:GNAT family N-acetyltransferase [Izhakiella australiensis]|uniref:GNAT family N-acetyltransferase n=1 Tax=Izhakiella australiensis TaxID=1926881 RepID=A0A1S8Y7N4_9GAMM|nr:GNAT family N-acetyltransferase [Izhakiella australiensis]OON34703.1 GNAT family N-acetyltransferase [Izhakiella australiensis]
MGITPPVLLEKKHVTSNFHCSELSLDDWLRRSALKNQTSGASRTFVVCSSESDNIVGFYALATGSVQRHIAPGAVRRNMPDPVPVLVLGRLGVDLNWQGMGIGSGLLKDAILRSKEVSLHVGTRALLVHALSDNARDFYEHWGFIPSGIQPETLLLPLW